MLTEREIVWGTQYNQILIKESGYDDIEDWQDITSENLKEMGFKNGHTKKFVRYGWMYWVNDCRYKHIWYGY